MYLIMGIDTLYTMIIKGASAVSSFSSKVKMPSKTNNTIHIG